MTVATQIGDEPPASAAVDTGPEVAQPAAFDRRYERPPGSTPEWFFETLRDVRRRQTGPVTITIELLGGLTVRGDFSAVLRLPRQPHGAIQLRDQRAFACEDMKAFTLSGDPRATEDRRGTPLH
jgi:hypothetical protein